MTPTPHLQKEILLSVKMKLATCKSIYYPDSSKEVPAIYAAELDANLYELLHPYPALYKFLFSDLVAHHEKRFDKKYLECRARLADKFNPAAEGMSHDSMQSVQRLKI